MSKRAKLVRVTAHVKKDGTIIWLVKCSGRTVQGVRENLSYTDALAFVSGVIGRPVLEDYLRTKIIKFRFYTSPTWPN